MKRDSGGIGDREIFQVLEKTLQWSQQEEYLGYHKHDALNSAILFNLLGWSKWSRIIAIQSMMRFPVNLRPLLLVPKSRNPKGIALFARAWMDRYAVTQDIHDLLEAEKLLSILLEHPAPGAWAGLCWGYPYPWQDLGFYAQPDTPNAVVTAFVCDALLAAYRLTQKRVYLESVGSAIDFFLKHLVPLKEDADRLCLSYMPMAMTMRVMDVSILIGSILAQYGAITQEDDKLWLSKRLVHYVVSLQTEEGAWFYTDPPADSPLRHDNYHTGFILDALWHYQNSTKDNSYINHYRRGLDFYARKLFHSSGAPRWMSDQEYPHDIHGAGQGILTFSRHQEEYPDLARKIATWAIAKMYHPEGRFYYQQHRWYTQSFTLLRWCNAWMCRGLAAFLVANKATGL